ncbi:MAG: hypothetical protein GY910_19720 [bacterium]|nr:hypothetical protein [bacterium]
MFHSPHLTSLATPARRLAAAVIATLFWALAAPVASAQQTFDLTPGQSLLNEQDPLWRSRGLAFVDLPLGFRVRYDAVYSRHLYASDLLSQPHADAFGPSIQSDSTLESRFALTRAIAEGIEFEIAWETRNSLAAGDLLGFGRQTIGARIRISP